MITSRSRACRDERVGVEAEQLGTKPRRRRPGVRQAKAATTVTMPYGIRTDVRTAPRPKIARCMTRASSMPSTSSIATEITVMITVLQHVLPPDGAS